MLDPTGGALAAAHAGRVAKFNSCSLGKGYQSLDELRMLGGNFLLFADIIADVIQGGLDRGRFAGEIRKFLFQR